MRQYADLLVQACRFRPPPCHIYSYPETRASQWGRIFNTPFAAMLYAQESLGQDLLAKCLPTIQW